MQNKGFLKFLMMFCILGTVLVSCDKDDDEEKIDLDQVHKFEITFVGQWSSNVYGELFPEDALFASFVGLTHNSPNKLYKLGNPASDGLAEYCKTGDSAQLVSDINSMIEDKSSYSLIQTGLMSPEGEIKVTFETNLRHRYITCVGRIAPSPDWFVSIENVDLRLLNHAGYGVTVLFHANDAGVKGGTSFSEPGQDTKEGISRISSGELSIEGLVPTIGYITIENKGIVSGTK